MLRVSDSRKMLPALQEHHLQGKPQVGMAQQREVAQVAPARDHTCRHPCGKHGPSASAGHRDLIDHKITSTN